VKIGLPAKLKVLKEYEGYDFKEQCKFCEKVCSAAVIFLINFHAATML